MTLNRHEVTLDCAEPIAAEAREDDMWSFNGLPLHPLLVHAAVVFGPLAALSAILYAVWGSRRDQLRWVTLVVVVIGFVSIWAAYLSGNNFFANAPQYQGVSGELKDKIDHHEALANVPKGVARFEETA